MEHTKQSITAQATANLPFGGLGVSLVACEEYAKTLHVQVVACPAADPCDGTPLHQPPLVLAGYRLLTVLGREIRGR